jgi:two-component system response regulator AtoC
MTNDNRCNTASIEELSVTNSPIIALSDIVVISRDAAVLGLVWSLGETRGWNIRVAGNAWEAMERIEEGIIPNLLLLDAVRGETDVPTVIRRLKRINPTLPIILIGKVGEEGKGAESARLGAVGYIDRPINEHQLELTIERSLAASLEAGTPDLTSDDIEQVASERFFIAVDEVMRRLRQKIEHLAETDAPVLIIGEPGTGKETIGRLIHQLSLRSPFEFAKVKCGVLPDDLMQRELVGSDEREGNGANRPRSGKLERCAHGTLFLDEVTELPLRLQELFLSVLKEKQFLRQDALCPVEADVRLLAGTSGNIRCATSGGCLRGDLAHYLSAHTIQVPPLRERRDDLPILARHFMHRLARHYGLPPRNLPPSLMERWCAYAWPGNLRELESEVKRYLMVGEKNIQFDKSQASSARTAPNRRSHTVGPTNNTATPPTDPASSGSGFKSLRALLRSVRSEAERNAIAMALQTTGWNRKAAARLLKVSYRTILYKIQQYQIISPLSAEHPGPNNHSNNSAVSSNHTIAGVRDLDTNLLIMVNGRHYEN